MVNLERPRADHSFLLIFRNLYRLESEKLLQNRDALTKVWPADLQFELDADVVVFIVCKTEAITL